jgi:hypothetical protein
VPTRTPRRTNGHGDLDGPTAPARVAAAYKLLPDASRAIGGVDADRRNIDVMLRGGHSADSELGWYYWARIPELRYVARYVANSASMARLFVGKVTDDPFNPEPVGPRHPANDLLDSFAGGLTGQSQVLDRLALHLTVPGEAILAGPAEGASPSYPFDTWRVFSPAEITSRNGTLWFRTPTLRDEPVPDGVWPFRVWRPHPRLWWEADSPTRSCYSVLREIDLLDQHVQATAISRLAGAGLMAIPDEITIPGDEVETEGADTDPFVKILTEVMALAIKNRESAAAIVPIILRGPAEFLKEIQHFDFSTKFDEKVPDLRTIALRRLALGMDVPPEIMLGTGDASHWQAWQVDESTLRVHTVPLLQLITGSLTEGWLRPALRQVPMSEAQKADIDKLVIWFDVSNLLIHPNVAQDSEALYDRFEINADALRLRTGHSSGDAPSRTQLVEQILLKLVRDNNPTMVPYALDALRHLGYPFPVALPVKADVPVGNILDEKGNIVPATDPGGAGLTPGPPSAPARPQGRPFEPGPAPATAPPTKPLPGQRSVDKQTSPPPAPPPSGDGARNG